MKIKTKSKLLIAILTLATIMGFFTFAIGTTRADSEVIYVDPPFSPETDTENIKDALQNAPPGSTVILREGVYCLIRPIVVADFDGIFKGQGKGKTIIKNFFADGHPFPAEPSLWGAPTFFSFYLVGEGTEPDSPANIEIADMTIKAIGYTDLWYHVPSGDPDRSFIPIEIGTFGEYYYNAKFSGIEILGQWGQHPSLEYTNILIGLLVVSDHLSDGLNSGEFIISDCYIENAFTPFEIADIRNSYIEISQNTFTNCVYNGGLIQFTQNTDLKFTQNKITTSQLAGLVLRFNNHSNAEISRNTLLNSPGFYLRNNDACSFLIEHNDIIMPIDSYLAGIEVWDEMKSDFVISHNKIHSENSLYWGPIWMVGVKDAVITNNKITGSGPAAMYIGLGSWTTDLVIIGNNLKNFQVTGYVGQYGTFPEVARIWLGVGTRECLVVGGHSKENVLDEDDFDPNILDENGNLIYKGWGFASQYAGGLAAYVREWQTIVYNNQLYFYYIPRVENGLPVTVLKNNILIGVIKIQGPIIGQEIKEAMEQKKDLMNFY